MDCIKCDNKNCPKSGFVHGRQRYVCKKCGYHFTVSLKSSAFRVDVKQEALHLYLEGMGLRAIGRHLQVSHVSVYRWIRAFGQQTPALESPSAIDVVEMDELHTYIGHKKYCWVWIAVDRYGHRFIDFVLGTRGYSTGKLLWESVQEKTIRWVMSDHWKVYPQMIPSHQLRQSKKETYTVEGYNTRLRHGLARLKRNTLCYSKSWLMLHYSILLLMHKLNYT
ncbi:IS1 family transposase [Rhodocytophaga rosea]|uniref:IS1 family transposase n=1 Tax=Rhodocytophaga rosea TaxID=2704465 RepID=UPI00374368C0